jgi:hypothetical protein
MKRRSFPVDPVRSMSSIAPMSVPNQRNRVIDDVGDEELRRGGACSHGPDLGVHRLVDRDVLVEMQADRPRDRAFAVRSNARKRSSRRR